MIEAWEAPSSETVASSLAYLDSKSVRRMSSSADGARELLALLGFVTAGTGVSELDEEWVMNVSPRVLRSLPSSDRGYARVVAHVWTHPMDPHLFRVASLPVMEARRALLGLVADAAVPTRTLEFVEEDGWDADEFQCMRAYIVVGALRDRQRRVVRVSAT